MGGSLLTWTSRGWMDRLVHTCRLQYFPYNKGTLVGVLLADGGLDASAIGLIGAGTRLDR